MAKLDREGEDLDGPYDYVSVAERKVGDRGNGTADVDVSIVLTSNLRCCVDMGLRPLREHWLVSRLGLPARLA